MKSRKRSLDTLPSKVNNEEIELFNINKGGNLDLIEEETDVLSETEKIAHCDVGEENHDEEENSNEVQENSDGEYLKTSSTGRSEILNEDHDTSDEEDLRNTVGNIPMKWYEDFVHIGYNLDGKTIAKPIRSQDELDKFLDKMENPDYWRTVHDEQTASKHVLSEEELQIVSRLKSGAFYDGSYDPYEAYVDFFTHEKMLHPISNRPEHKRSFIPSLNEKRKVGKIVHAIKMGWLKLHKPKQEEDSERKFYDLWADSSEDQQQTKRSAALQKMHIPPPKPKLPGHEASYNPPEEYLPTPAEIEAMKNEEDDDDVITDKFKLLPTKYDSLRQVPQYQHFIQERFARSLDLYLCPRQRKMKVNVNPDDLIPDLPRPSDLRPFPTFQALCYHGHKAMIRTISVDPTGQWLASGSDDGCVNVWEVATARCVRKLKLDPLEAIKCAAWCPNVSICLFAVAVGKQAVVMNPCVGDRLVHQATDQLINSYLPPDDEDDDGETVPAKRVVDEWTAVEAGAEFADGKRLIIRHPKHVSKVEWHGKGDYFATTMPGNGHQQVLLHQLTKRRSQNPFNKLKGQVQCVAFHPTQPLFFVATQRYVRVYNLMKQELTRKLLGNSKWISSIAVHPGGDNLLVGSYDCRLSWFDMDLSSKPFATMRYHKKAIRACCFHRKYPLFASAADDATVVVGHGMVYNDLLQNPLIVPVKVLKGHRVERNVGVLDCCFHPTQPWLFSSAADHVIRLFT